MKSKKLLTLLAAAGMASAANAATIITPTGATSTLDGLSGRLITETIDGSGLSGVGDILTQTHVVSSGTVDYYVGAKANVLTFELGDSYTVGAVHLWTYARTNEHDRAIQSFDISFSSDGGLNYGPTITLSGWTNYSWSDTPTAPPITVQSQSFTAQSGITHVKLSNIVNNGDPTYTAFSEIRFADAIPEPGAALLGGLGLLALLRRRRG